jgi:alpha-tubulin suppressor-like RCC1 family protein
MRSWLLLFAHIGCSSGDKSAPDRDADGSDTDTDIAVAVDPEGRLSAGYSHSCGLRPDGSGHCWGTSVGDWDYGQVNDTPTGTFRSVSVGGYFSCGVGAYDGQLSCWGEDKAPPEGVAFDYVNVGVDHACGLQSGDEVLCWGDNIYGETEPPAERFAAVSAGNRHTCGITEDGRTLCWGKDDRGQSTVPDGDFAQVSAGAFQTCAIDGVGGLHCWGEPIEPPPSGRYTQVSAARSGTHACAVSTEGTLACWGYNGYGQADAPGGLFSDVSAGATHSCGIDMDGEFHCWGQDNYGEATP